MGLSEGGQELTYGFEMALATQPNNVIAFPGVPVTLGWVDKSVRAEHQNLAGDERVSYQKILAPVASFSLDGLSFEDRAKWRSLAITTGEFYIVRMLRRERLFGIAATAYDDGGTIKVRLPNSSYSLASKKSVAAGGPGLVTLFSVFTSWADSIADGTSVITVTGPAADGVTLTLGGVPPADGQVVYINFTATAWLAKVGQGPQFNPITGAAPNHSGTIVFEGA